jgi:tetratricopeptide (TPR) repeat protein
VPGDLTEGSYLDATFEQRGVDLAVEVFAPGRRLYSIDSPNRDQGPEDLHLIAPTTGRYRFEVTTGDGAPAGTYTPVLHAVRSPTESDRSQAGGDLALSQAQEIAADPARFWEAVARYQKAILLLQEAGDRLDHGYAYFLMDRLYAGRSENREAVELFSRAAGYFGGPETSTS